MDADLRAAHKNRKRFMTYTLKQRVALHERARECGLLSRTVVDASRSSLQVVHKTRLRFGELVIDAKDAKAHGICWWSRSQKPLRIHVKAWLQPTTFVEIGPARAFEGGRAERIVIGGSEDAHKRHVVEYKGWLLRGGIAKYKDWCGELQSLKAVVSDLRSQLLCSLETATDVAAIDGFKSALTECGEIAPAAPLT